MVKSVAKMGSDIMVPQLTRDTATKRVLLSHEIIQAHPEMQLYIGLDVDPIAHEQAQSRINAVVRGDPCDSSSGLKAHVFLKNFRDIEFVLPEVDEKLLIYGVDGILMDLGMSSMQVNNAERGFSVLCDGPLDMRMNPQSFLVDIQMKMDGPQSHVR
ncbi:unnamed protein product [Thlaspi arvense]|uniref:Uncharacterized protein n=1 Tax=Thlaspi arvense TaxID=13288 RepID=A0AAU9S5V8_THLAR|nr:unnamed protein product [Thlaspi arvense]